MKQKQNAVEKLKFSHQLTHPKVIRKQLKQENKANIL